MPKIKYHAIVEEIYDRVHFRSKVTGSTDMENILARFLEDLEGDILDHHRDLNDDPEATWEAIYAIIDPTEPGCGSSKGIFGEVLPNHLA